MSTSTLPRPSRRSARRRAAYAVAALLVLVGIVLLTMMPPQAKHLLHTRGRFHTLAHVLAFLILAFAAGRAAKSRTMLLPLVTALILFGFCTELAEHIFFTIPLEWQDILADSIGASLGLSLAALTRRRSRSPSLA